jgi:hypothetical protein
MKTAGSSETSVTMYETTRRQMIKFPEAVPSCDINPARYFCPVPPGGSLICQSRTVQVISSTVVLGECPMARHLSKSIPQPVGPRLLPLGMWDSDLILASCTSAIKLYGRMVAVSLILGEVPGLNLGTDMTTLRFSYLFIDLEGNCQETILKCCVDRFLANP